MHRENQLLKNTLVLSIGTFFPKFGIFILLPILTSQLPKYEYGIYDLVVTLAALIVPLTTFQIQAAAFRYLIDSKDIVSKTKLISNVYIFALSVSVIGLSVVYFLFPGDNVLLKVVICIYYFVDIIVNINRQIIRGMLRNIDYTISSVISGIGHITLVLLLVYCMEGKLIAAISALIIAETVACIYLFIRGNIWSMVDFSNLDFSIIKRMLEYSWPMLPNSVAQWVIHTSDRLIITYFLGLSATAIYSVAYKIPSILSLAQATFNLSWQENASIAVTDNDSTEYYTSMFKVLFKVVSGLMALLIGFTPILFFIFVNGDYNEAYHQIPILFMGMYFLCLSTFWGGVFVAIKQTKAVGVTTVLSAVLSLVIHLSLIQYLGLYAGSIASVISYFVMCIYRAVVLNKYIKIQYDLIQIIIVVLLLCVQCAFCYQRNLCLDLFNIVLGFILFYKFNEDLLKKLMVKIRLKF